MFSWVCWYVDVGEFIFVLNDYGCQVCLQGTVEKAVIGNEKGETGDGKRESGRNHWERIRTDPDCIHLLWIYLTRKREGKKGKRGVKETSTNPSGSEQKPALVFIMVEAGGNRKSSQRSCKVFLYKYVCVQRRMLWLTRQTLCGLTQWAGRVPELENTFSLRRLPLSQPAAQLLWWC